jgi:tyrosinase
VWANGGDFSDPTLLWYAKGVGILKQRPITDPTSWTFLAAIHGINIPLWINFEYLAEGASLPSAAVQTKFWQQCQHQSWYFLPWHRGYILSLEAIVCAAIIDAGGPADWALPYWNYSDTNNPNTRDLPSAFSAQTLPDGTPNPLFVQRRYGQQQGSIPIPQRDVNLTRALNSTVYTGSNGGNPGFGGLRTGFSHGGGVSGNLESVPHNGVHVDIGRSVNGGRRLTDLGLMTNPDTAALDPTFYCHHANIDRLWQVWLERGAANRNPTDAAWLTGPADRKFCVPKTDGTAWEYTAEDVLSTEDLGYSYDDTADPLEGESAAATRMERLSAALEAIAVAPESEVAIMDDNKRAELIGANEERMTLLGSSASTKVQLDNRTMQRTFGSFAEAANVESAVPEPDRVYLNLENVRSAVDGQVIDVYVNLPDDADPSQHPDRYVGTLALFGVSKASQTDQPHGGTGVTEVFDITDVIDAIQMEGALADLSELDVQLKPRNELTEDHNITIERISVYREGN